MTELQKMYLVDSRASAIVDKHGSVQAAIKFLKVELNKFENLWSKYSSDCLGHGIICNRLMIRYLEDEFLRTDKQ